jgi:putative hydrolase
VSSDALRAAGHLAEIAYRLRLGGDAYRGRAYVRAALTLARQAPDLEALRRQRRLATLEGVGEGIARTLEELLASGTSSYLERLREGQPEPSSSLGWGPVAALGYRGDLHAHTDWSDGRATVGQMAVAARARGYRYLAITDHSPRLRMVHGLGPERLAAQRAVIDEVNRELDGLTVLQGVEVDINEDGSLDEPDAALAGLDVVIASPHVKLGTEPAAMTERMLGAVEHPLVDVLGHPTGRRPGERPGASYDLEAVLRAAAAHGVVVEIDCDPSRTDLGPEQARLAASLGCRLALDSDAHAPDQLVYVDLGLWVARQAGLGEEDIVNWLPLEQLKEVFEKRRWQRSAS